MEPSATVDGPCRICSSDADRADLEPGAARQVGVVRLAAPVIAVARRLRRPGERRPDHDSVGAERQRLGDVAAAGHAAIGDDVHVPSAGFVQVVAPGRGHVGDRGRHRDRDAEHGGRRVTGAAAEAGQHARGAGAHQVQRGGVRRAAADDHRHVQLVDELLQVERLGLTGHVLGRHRRAADHEDVDARVDDRLVVAHGPLRRQPGRGGDAGRADLLDPLADQLLLDRLGVDLLKPPGRRLVVQLGRLGEQRLRVIEPGPQALEVKRGQSAELADR